MHPLMKQFLSLSFLLGALVGAGGMAKAQTPAQLESLVQMYVPHPQGLIHQIATARNLLESGQIHASIQVFQMVELSIASREGAGPNGLSSATVDILIGLTDQIIGALDAGPTGWWCDHDGDGYTVFWGMAYFAPNPYCYNSALLGHDPDDGNPNLPVVTWHWWQDCDGDGYYVDLGQGWGDPPSPCILAAPEDPGACADIDDADPTVLCV